MPVPKKRHSKTRSRKRRTHWKLTPPAVVDCPHCHEPKRPHRVCLNCGYYAGREVIVVSKDTEKSK